MTRILVVEDNVAVLEGIVFGLKMRGFDLLEATSGSEALALLESADPLPEVIVSDIAMPDIDGYQLLEEVQNNPRWQSIPFIILTAYDTQEDIHFARRQGADDYLIKPVSINDLVSAIENKLRRRAMWSTSGTQVKQDLISLITKDWSNAGSSQQSLYYALPLEKELEGLPDEFSHRALETLQQANTIMQRLSNNITLLIQLDSGLLKQKFDAESKKSSVEHLLESAAQLVKQELFSEESDFVFNLPKEPLIVSGLENLLIIALTELIRNAVIHSKRAGTIFLSASAPHDTVEICIRDHGAGIPANVLPEVWERFAKFHAPVDDWGAGLGLPIVQAIIALHGGMVEITSKPGIITEAKITLPRV